MFLLIYLAAPIDKGCPVHCSRIICILTTYHPTGCSKLVNTSLECGGTGQETKGHTHISAAQVSKAGRFDLTGSNR